MKNDNLLNEDLIREVFSAEAIEYAKEQSQKVFKLMSCYKCAIMEIETKFNVLNEEFSLRHDRNPISSIKTRLKSLPSIKEKMQRKGLTLNVKSLEDNISDVAGVRVICTFPQDAYMLADALLQQDDIELVKMKDYIKNPKENGYRSLHLIVTVPVFFEKEKKVMRVEIQLRTIAMDFWASIEHQLRYKKDFEYTKEMADELLSIANLSAELDGRMDELRKKIHGDKT